MKEVFLGLAAVRVKSQKSSMPKRRSSLLNIIKPGKENVGPSVASLGPAAGAALVSDRVSVASEDGAALATTGDASSGGGLSDLENGTIPESSSGQLDGAEVVKQRKKQRRLANFGVRPADEGEHCF